MAPHDVLFLHSRRDWFAEYHRRFAADYRTGKVNDPMMVRLFERAEAELAKSRNAEGGNGKPNTEKA
jgi:hypothetical protein